VPKEKKKKRSTRVPKQSADAERVNKNPFGEATKMQTAAFRENIVRKPRRSSSEAYILPPTVVTVSPFG
jgi:hypothetical protein